MFNLFKCKKCSSRNKIENTFWISKVDAIGFLFLSALLTLPVYFVTFLIESSQGFAAFIIAVAIFIEYAEKQYKVMALLIAELIIETMVFNSSIGSTSIVVITAFIVTFYTIGKKVYGFFFLCVDYKFKSKIYCPSCNVIAKNISLPSVPSD